MFKYIFAGIMTMVMFSGCATAPLPPGPAMTPPPGTISHRIEKGQTLWKISQMYGVDVDELIRINRIADASNIEPGNVLFVPAAQVSSPNLNPQAEDFVWPLKGRITGQYGQRFNHIINRGITIQPAGTSDIFASRTGKVAFYNQNVSGFGKTIIIDHGNRLLTVYTGIDEVLVNPGSQVNRGDVIARTKSSLNFQIRKGHQPQNPLFYLPNSDT